MKKFRMFMMFAMLMMLLAGCGQTQDEKITEVQAANAITTADVVDLLEYRDLTVEKQTPSDAWMKQWPDIEIYKINGENLLLMQATEGLHLYQRDKLVQDLKWRSGYLVFGVEETALLNQLMKDYPLETGFYAQNVNWEAKNVIACYVPYYDSAHPEELDWENEDVRLTWQAVAEDVGALRDEVKAVFYEDINDLDTVENTVEGEKFDLAVNASYYLMPFEVDGNTTYDVYYDLDTCVTLHEEEAALFEGQEVLGEVRCIAPPATAATKGMSVGGSFEELLADDNQMTFGIDDRFIAGPQPQEQLEFQVIITVGDYEETFSIMLYQHGLDIGHN